MIFRIFIGYEPRQAEAYMVCKESVRRHAGTTVVIKGVLLDDLIRRGWYTRPTKRLLGTQTLVDELSISQNYNGAMSTEHAIARFFVPYLARSRDGWAIFLDNDTMARSDLGELFELLEKSRDKALMCVHHDQRPLYVGADGLQPSRTKMDDQLQTAYYRKNWSSVMAFNLGHPANDRLTPEMLNTLPGRELHRFCWLHDSEIGELPAEWNWLVRVSAMPHPDDLADPKIVHWTLGGPWLPAFARDPWSDEWFYLRDSCVMGSREEMPRRYSGVSIARAHNDELAPSEGELHEIEMLRPAWLGG